LRPSYLGKVKSDDLALRDEPSSPVFISLKIRTIDPSREDLRVLKLGLTKLVGPPGKIWQGAGGCAYLLVTGGMDLGKTITTSKIGNHWQKGEGLTQACVK